MKIIGSIAPLFLSKKKKPFCGERFLLQKRRRFLKKHAVPLFFDNVKLSALSVSDSTRLLCNGRTPFSFTGKNFQRNCSGEELSFVFVMFSHPTNTLCKQNPKLFSPYKRIWNANTKDIISKISIFVNKVNTTFRSSFYQKVFLIFC